ncbi:hypothetical protein B277_09642 [Janibacter hoylei PVAS-1]|uniref:Uncharacterized protein n=1 Tax=Janibacter hoylei PVAS-1 TaxID=1210046 RepID=K1E1S2_9MICO|nr:hypothetical protein B277_09642 [Janibacter hoylei PVAS-1]
MWTPGGEQAVQRLQQIVAADVAGPDRGGEGLHLEVGGVVLVARQDRRKGHRIIHTAPEVAEGWIVVDADHECASQHVRARR